MTNIELKELTDGIKETIQHHLFDTADELASILEEKYNISKNDISYEMVNGVNELTIRIPDTLNECICKVTILGEEVVCGE